MSTFKCPYCKGTEQKPYPYDYSYVEYNGNIFHPDCLVKKMTRVKKDKWNTDEVKQKIEELKQKTKSSIEYEQTSEQLVSFLEKQYGIIFVPKYFFEKIKAINDGTYKGLTKPVPIKDLFDMWQIKIDWLKKQGLKKWKCDSVEALTRINYDLAILLGKYSSYLEWKNGLKLEQEIAEKQIESTNISNIVFTTAKSNSNKKKENSIDISNIIDELFD